MTTMKISISKGSLKKNFQILDIVQISETPHTGFSEAQGDTDKFRFLSHFLKI